MSLDRLDASVALPAIPKLDLAITSARDNYRLVVDESGGSDPPLVSLEEMELLCYYVIT